MLYFFMPNLITNNKIFFIIFKAKITFLLIKQIQKIFFYKTKKDSYINDIEKILIINIVTYIKN